jgi:hypothetical protein
MNLEQFKPILIILLILNKYTDVKIDCISHLNIQLHATVRKFSLSIPTMVSFLHRGLFLKKKVLCLSLPAISFPEKNSTLEPRKYISIMFYTIA